MLIPVLLAAASLAAAAEGVVKGRVADLAWMTGSWVGPFGDQTLEEHWVQPANGTIACLVRISGDDTTDMLELIVIEDAGDSLVFRVRQWFPGFVPRKPEAQVMELQEIGENQVSFSGSGDVDFRTLTYSRPNPDEFHIDAETMAGDALHLRLHARSASDAPRGEP